MPLDAGSSGSPFGALSILVADPNSQTRELLVENLTLLGVTSIATASNGQEALAALKSGAMSLLICDRHMPLMDGLALTRFIRTDKRSPDRALSIVMMSSAVDEGKLFEARDAGIDEFLIKPPSMQALYAHLQGLLKRPRDFIEEEGYTGPDRRRGHRPPHEGTGRRATDRDSEVEAAPLRAAARRSATARSRGPRR